MLLLLILFAGCLATSAAQTTAAFPNQITPNTTAPMVLPTTAAPEEYVAILQAAVNTTAALNNNTFGPIWDQLRELIIQKLQTDPGITLVVKNVTKV